MVKAVVDAALVEPGAGTHHATRWDPFDNARHRFGVASESQTGCPSLADEKRKARR
jgi:hypothetical protein